MDKDKVTIILGPPGTGKTTRLLDTVSDLLDDCDPEDICFITFTRKASNEARDRAVIKFGLDTSRFRWFRTCHSLAFSRLSMSRAQMMNRRDWIQIAKMLGLFFNFNQVTEDGVISGMSIGDRMLFMENLARIRGEKLYDVWVNADEPQINWPELERLRDTIVEYKGRNYKMDFTDLLEKFMLEGTVPDVKYLIVDEAQDLSKLQWRLVDKVAEKVKGIWIAGDDDQAIFKWSGADVDTLIDMEGTVHVLDKSYRVPNAIHILAESIITRVQHRRPKSWVPRDYEGDVLWHTDVDQVDASEGTWLMIARNTYFLNKYVKYCMDMGYLFTSRVENPISKGLVKAIYDWEKLRKKEEIPMVDVARIYEFMNLRERVTRGFKSKVIAADPNMMVNIDTLHESWGLRTDFVWYDALDRINVPEKQYIRTCLAQGEKLTGDPRIHIDTIHGVKGGEADHVLLITDMTNLSYREYKRNEDDETRIWYVAMTRARMTLNIVSPQTALWFPM